MSEPRCYHLNAWIQLVRLTQRVYVQPATGLKIGENGFSITCLQPTLHISPFRSARQLVSKDAHEPTKAEALGKDGVMFDASDAQRELALLRGGLVVSCQARETNPLHGPLFMTAMARAAVAGGAVGIRANGPQDVEAIRGAVTVPILGINKVQLPSGELFITPTCGTAKDVMTAGAKLVALDGTDRPRPGGESLADVIQCIHEFGCLAFADVSTLNEGLRAVDLGADAVGTTLSGYTPYSRQQSGPDYVLLQELVSQVSVPVFAEGRMWSPQQASEALALGASFVVVGTAITNPQVITQRYVEALSLQNRQN